MFNGAKKVNRSRGMILWCHIMPVVKEHEKNKFRGQKGMQDVLEGEGREGRQPIETTYHKGFAVKGSRYVEP